MADHVGTVPFGIVLCFQFRQLPPIAKSMTEDACPGNHFNRLHYCDSLLDSVVDSVLHINVMILLIL